MEKTEKSTLAFCMHTYFLPKYNEVDSEHRLLFSNAQDERKNMQEPRYLLVLICVLEEELNFFAPTSTTKQKLYITAWNPLQITFVNY